MGCDGQKASPPLSFCCRSGGLKSVLEFEKWRFYCGMSIGRLNWTMLNRGLVLFLLSFFFVWLFHWKMSHRHCDNCKQTNKWQLIVWTINWIKQQALELARPSYNECKFSQLINYHFTRDDLENVLCLIVLYTIV